MVTPGVLEGQWGHAEQGDGRHAGSPSSRPDLRRIAAALLLALPAVVHAGDAFVAPGAGPGNPSTIRGLSCDGTRLPSSGVEAYPSLRHGVNVALGAHLQGTVMIWTCPGPDPSALARVRAWRIAPGAALAPMAGMEAIVLPGATFGARVAAGDIDGRPGSEIVVAPGPAPSFGPRVRGWRVGAGALSPIPELDLRAFPTAAFGANVAAGDVDGDGCDEVLATPGPGPSFGAQVRGWDHDGAGAHPIARLHFFAFPTTHGGEVAAGDVDGDGFDEIAAAPGPDPTAAAMIRGFDYDELTATPLMPSFTSSPSRYGARVALGELHLDARASLLAGPGPDPSSPGIVVVRSCVPSRSVPPFLLAAWPDRPHGAAPALAD